jgi:HK97 family phage major capsid protein
LTTVNGQLQEKKAVCIFAVSMELLRAGGPGVTRLLQTELTNGVALATDTEFVSVLTSGIVAIPSSGTTALAVRADLRGLLASVNTDKASRLYLLMQPSTAEQLAAMGDANGGPAFQQMQINGGSICGIPAVTTDAVAFGQLVLVDAAQICAGQRTITLDASTEAAIQLDTAPDSPASASTVPTSLFQNDLAAIRASRIFGCLRLRATAVATLSGASYLGNSPS